MIQVTRLAVHCNYFKKT